ncbi:MAG: hypothetical protein WD627_06290 [Actinomycetota bacterium]
MKQLLAFAALLPLLLGCSSVNEAVVGNPTEPAPVDYRSIALAGLKTTLFDPYSVRDAQISQPQWLGSWNLGEGNGWVVCFRGNAKNRMGAYTGIKDTAILIRGNKVLATNSDLPPNSYYCGSAVFGPFPEIEAA